MPLLIILGILVLIIGVVIFTINKRDSDHFIEMQLNEKAKRREHIENLNTFNNDPTSKRNSDKN